MRNHVMWTPRTKKPSTFQKRVPVETTSVSRKTKSLIAKASASRQAVNLFLASPPPFQTPQLAFLRSRVMRGSAQPRFQKRSRPLLRVKSPAGAEEDPGRSDLCLLPSSEAEEGHEREEKHLPKTHIQQILPMTAAPGNQGIAGVPIEVANALPQDPPGQRTGTVVDL